MQAENKKDGINEFVQKNRKALLITGIVILVLLIGAIAALSIIDKLNGKAIAEAEDLSSRYDTLHPTITEDFSEIDVTALLDDLAAFAKKNRGYPSGKAWSVIAAIHGDRGEWASAEDAWVQAAKSAKKTYLVPLAWFNAGASAEEQGKTGEAIGYYTSSLESADDFPLAPRAQFAIGRLQESRGEITSAIDAYRSLISTWPFDRVWTSLAHSRVIALEAE